MSVKRIAAVAASVLAFLLLCAGAASAHPNPRVFLAAKGPAGVKIQVSGQDWAGQTIEFRWDSASGPIFGTWGGNATGWFEGLTLQIPKTADMGLHYVVAVGKTLDGVTTVARETSNPFTVTALYSETVEIAPPLPAPQSPQAPEGVNPGPDQTQAATPAGTTATETVPAPPAGTTATETVPAPPAGTTATETISANRPVATVSGGTATPQTAAAVPVLTAASPAAKPQTANSAAARTVPAASVSTDARAGATAGTNVASAPRAPTRPRFRSGDDVASGYDGSASSRIPGVATSAGAGHGVGGLSSVGVGVLAGGLVALFAGFGVVQVRRRKPATNLGD